MTATALAAQQKAPKPREGFLQNRPLKVVDGSSVTLPDSSKNRKSYPKIHKEACVFPMMRVVVLFALASGAILAARTGSLFISELTLLRQLLGELQAGDILLGDRGFGNFVVLRLLQGTGVDFIGRSIRKVDPRQRQKKLGPNDWLMTWKKSRSIRMSPQEWRSLPRKMTVRVLVASYRRKGFRVQKVVLVTTLLDPALYSAQQIIQAYQRRWRL